MSLCCLLDRTDPMQLTQQRYCGNLAAENLEYIPQYD